MVEYCVVLGGFGKDFSVLLFFYLGGERNYLIFLGKFKFCYLGVSFIRMRDVLFYDVSQFQEFVQQIRLGNVSKIVGVFFRLGNKWKFFIGFQIFVYLVNYGQRLSFDFVLGVGIVVLLFMMYFFNGIFFLGGFFYFFISLFDVFSGYWYILVYL